MPAAEEPHLDPVRGRRHVHALDPAAHEARAQPLVLDADPKSILGPDARILGDLGRGHPDLAAGDGRHLPGDPDDRQRVARGSA